MSRLVNQNWINFNGEPVTGRTPPTLIVYGPPMTSQQEGEVAHTYKLFTDANLVALGQYQVRNRVFADGTRVRCVSINGVDTVQVWTSASKKDEFFFGGFLFRPQDDFGDNKTFWGKPVTTLNAPLGTEFGDLPTSWLRTLIKRKNSRAKASFKVERFVSDQYGTLDWQGADAETDVLSWNAMDLGVFTFSTDGNAAIVQNTPNRYFAGDVSEPDLLVSTVRRYNSFGTDSKVFSRFLKIESFSGYVCGAARHKGRLLAVTTTHLPYQMNAVFSVVTKVNGVEIDIGSYTVPARHIVTQCWYFNRTGNKARSVALGEYGGFAIEVTIEESTANASGLVATFAVVEGSEGGGYQTSNSVLRLSYQAADISQSGSGTYYGVEGPNKYFVVSLTGTISVSAPVTEEAGGVDAETPYVAVDFIGDEPVSMSVRQSGAFWELSGSSSFSHTMTGDPEAGTEGYIQTWNASASASRNADRAFVALVVRSGDVTETIPLGSRATTRDQITQSGSWTYTVPRARIGDGVLSGSNTLTTRYRRGDYKRALDFDLRHKAFLFYQEGDDTTFQSASSTKVDSAPIVSTTASFPGEAIVVKTLLNDVEVTATSIGTTPATSSVGYGGPLGGPGGSISGTIRVEGDAIFAMPYSGYNFAGPDPGIIIRRLVAEFYQPSLLTMREFLFPADTPRVKAGAIRTYYGQACATGIIGDTTDQVGGTPEKFFSHISDAGEQNANVLVEIAGKDRPWFFKLGVV